MIRTIIIDDEPIILRSIKKSIESKDSEFTVIGDATDGKKGLELIRKLKPDLVFVDICMPVIDGLELIRLLREERNLVPIVVVSGYKEFDYAKQALSFGVWEYLVKPINPLGMKDFLTKIKDKINTELVRSKHNILAGLLHADHSEEYIANREEFIEKEETFFLIKICLGSYNSYRYNQFEPIYSIKKTFLIDQICNQLEDKFSYWLIDGKYSNEAVIILSTKEENVQEIVKKLYECICNELEKAIPITFIAAKNSCTYDKIFQTYIDLESTLYHNLIFSCSSFCSTEEIASTETWKIDFVEDIHLMKALISQKKEAEVKSLTKKIVFECEKRTYTQANLYGLLKKLISNSCFKDYNVDIDFIVNLILVNSKTYKDLNTRLLESLRTYSDMSEKTLVEDVKSEEVVDHIETYIKVHYAERILIQEIADQFGFNYSYLCFVFKKYKGISPNEYIIEKRMEKAKKLLREHLLLSIKEIATLVGYEDQYYFSRIFKNNVGCTPSVYRRQS